MILHGFSNFHGFTDHGFTFMVSIMEHGILSLEPWHGMAWHGEPLLADGNFHLKAFSVFSLFLTSCPLLKPFFTGSFEFEAFRR